MILDCLAAIGNYRALHPRFADAIAFLRRTDLHSLPDGKIILEEDRLVATVMRAFGRKADDALLEAHRRFIDIQVLLEGAETIGWKAAATCRDAVAPFDEEKDIVFFRDAPASFVSLHPADFALFFPRDAHAPMIGEGSLHKVVVKVAVD